MTEDRFAAMRRSVIDGDSAAAGALGANAVRVSALLTTTMVGQRAVIAALADAGLRDSVKVIVGGAPVTRAWADEVGADGYGEDAVGAVTVARALPGA